MASSQNLIAPTSFSRQGDTWVPPFEVANWREVSRADHAPDADNPHHYSFIELEKTNGPK